jgi:hypothetical protein
MESIPATSATEVLDTTLFVWGDKLFVSRADVNRMSFLTEVIIAALAFCDRRHLSVTGSRNLPIELVLSMGVSNYLEVDSVSIRVHGMRAAQAYAKVIGEPLHFAELDVIDAQEEKKKSAAVSSSQSAAPSSSSSSSSSSNTSEPGKTLLTARSRPAKDTSVGYDTDSSEELVGYNVDDEDGMSGVYNYKDKLLKTNYLRDCLQSELCDHQRHVLNFLFISSFNYYFSVLRCPESKPEARQQLQAALVCRCALLLLFYCDFSKFTH